MAEGLWAAEGDASKVDPHTSLTLLTVVASGPTPTRINSTSVAQSVWDLEPFARGRAIEQALGTNLPSNFPVIDRFAAGAVTSIKSMDLAAKSYQNPATITRIIRSYVNSIARFTGRRWAGSVVRGADITSRTVELAVPATGGSAAQQAGLQAGVKFGQSKGVTVRIIPF